MSSDLRNTKDRVTGDAEDHFNQKDNGTDFNKYQDNLNLPR